LPEGSTAEITTAQSLVSDDDRGAIAFFPDGSSSGGRIRLGLDGHVRRIDVEWLTGRIALVDERP
jgi:general secretion pathway protein H